MKLIRTRAGDDSVRLKRHRIRAIWGPLSVREKIVYGSVLVFLVGLILSQATGARAEDFGRTVQIPSRQCLADFGWNNPQKASGQPIFSSEGLPPPIDPLETSSTYGEVGGLVCSSFAKTNDVRVETALTVYLSVDSSGEVIENTELVADPMTPESPPEDNATTLESAEDNGVSGGLPSDESKQTEIPIASSTSLTPDFVTRKIQPRSKVVPADLAATSQISLDQLLTIEVTTSDSPDMWQSIAVVTVEDVTADPTQYSVLLPKEFSVGYELLQVRLTPLHAGSNTSTIHIDSVNLTYIVGSKKELRIRPKSTASIDEGAQWSLPYTREFDFELVVHDPNVSLLDGLVREASNSLTDPTAPVLDAEIILTSKQSGNVVELEVPETNWISNSVAGDDVWDVKLQLPSSLEPGNYTLTATVVLDESSTATFTQDFLWGVLAMNFDASVYIPGDEVNAYFAVLDEFGHSVCDAELIFEVFFQDNLVKRNTFSNGDIEQSPTCNQYIPDPPPDYFTSFTPHLAGTYDVLLTAITNSGTFQITDSITSENSPAIVISRQAPTRIYPIFRNTMVTTITSDVSQAVIVRDYVPSSFVIDPVDFAEEPISERIFGDLKELTWHINLKADQPLSVGYQFDAPDISPEFYLIGPLEIEGPGKVFTFEPRSWQLAGDAVGDFAVYREATGTETITTSLSNQAWDNTVTEGTAFTINAGTRDTIDLADAGHYFISYNLALNGSSGRSETNALVDVAGTNLAYGRSTCFVRRANAINECWLAGSAIFDANAGDDVVIEAQRTDGGAGTVTRRANESGISLMKLDDAWDYALIQEAGGGQAFNSTTFASVDWDTNDELDSGSFTHSIATNTDQIELGTDGHYLVNVNVMFQNSSTTARRSNLTRLTLNGTEIEGTRTSAYPRGTDSTQDHAAVYSGIIVGSANDILRVQAACEGEACGGITNVGGQTAISIVKLPDSARYLMLRESGGGQAVDATDDPITWDTQDEIDGDFSHSLGTNPSRIDIDTTDDYLFLTSFFSDRTGSTANVRQQPHWEWRTGGSSLLQYGSVAQYNRGNGGTTGTFSSGSSSAVIFNNLADTTYVELINTDESSSTDSNNVFVADRYAVQAVNITSLFASDPYTEQLHFRWRDDTTALNTSGGWAATEDSNALGDLSKGDRYRIRFEVANTGTTVETQPRRYELEFADKGSNGNCSAASSWTGLTDSATDDLEGFLTSNYANDAVVTPGLLANTESYTFASGRAQEGTDDTTLNILALGSGAYTEIEYTVEIQDAAVTGHTYCFRLYDERNTTALNGYQVFPEITLVENSAGSPSGLGEAGQFTAPVNGGWATVSFVGNYTAPIVVGISNSHDSQNALVFEARNITSTSAEMRLCESEGSTSAGCDTHAVETGGYMVIDETVADTVAGIEAGTFTTSGADDTTNVTTVYGTAFTSKPSVFANVNTVNDADQPTEVIINSVTTANFNSGLCQHLNGSDDLCDTTHASETIGWVAIEPGNEPFDEFFQHSQTNIDTDGGSWVTVNFSPAFAATPAFLGASQTDTGGQDPEIDNARSVSTTSADIRFCEMDATDTCDSHAADDFVWFAIDAVEFENRYNLDQDTFRFYQNNDAIQPVTPLGSENTAISGVSTNDVIRVRTGVQVGELDLPVDEALLKLQYGRRVTTCAAISSWNDVGSAGSSTVWRGFDNATPVDGADITASLLNGTSNELESYVEENDSPVNPTALLDGERGEWDWVVENHAATEGTDYCFRMTLSDGDVFTYTRYPWLSTSGTNAAPNSAASLTQTKIDDTNLTVGDWTDETSVEFKADGSDADSVDTIRLCVEVDNLATSFSNTEDVCGSYVVYTGTTVALEVPHGIFLDATSYHWQVRVQDGGDLYSPWVSFGANPESSADFSVDLTPPSGTVYDGTTTDVDADFNDGSLDELSANWDITDASSGNANFDYSIGTTPGATDTFGWTDNDLVDSFTQGILTLQTSQLYFINVRSTDVAGNQSIISSDGQFVAPTLSFSVAPAGVAFEFLHAGNTFTDTEITTVTTSTNAYNGYEIRVFASGLLTSQYADTIGWYDGGTYAAPDGWLPADKGFGYTSSDILVQGINIFNPVTCAGGNPSPCYVPFTTTKPGDIAADHTTLVVGAPITNESFTITHRVTSDATQAQGTYITEVVFSVVPIY